MNYVSIADINDYIIRNLHIFPHDIDLVVGIPRSGMLPANLLALYLNKPYTDIDSFVEGRVYGTGWRGKFIEQTSIKKILIVDDSINTGESIQKAQEIVKKLQNQYIFQFAAIIATENSKNCVDYYCTIVNQPRFFQWNLFHHPFFIPNSCFDIDGVLCENPPIDDDGPIYLDYIKNAIPKYIPSIEINMLVTCRLEKYRAATEEWLMKNKVKYKHLVMLNMNSREDRILWGKHGEYKGKIYLDSQNLLFVESSLVEAKKIAKTSKKPVFCTETFTLLNYEQEFSFFNRSIYKVKSFLKRVYSRI